MTRGVQRNRQDSNHHAVEMAFRKLGCATRSTHDLGDGFPDILCAARGVTWLVEVKDGSLPPSKRKLTKDEELFHKWWPGLIYVVESVEQVPSVVMDACGDRP